MIQCLLVDFFYLALVRPTHDTPSPQTVLFVPKKFKRKMAGEKMICIMHVFGQAMIRRVINQEVRKNLSLRSIYPLPSEEFSLDMTQHFRFKKNTTFYCLCLVLFKCINSLTPHFQLTGLVFFILLHSLSLINRQSFHAE